MTVSPQGSPPRSSTDGRHGTQKVVVRLGDILCTSSTVATPSGCAPLDQVQWHVEDRTTLQTRPLGRLLRRPACGSPQGAVDVTAAAVGWRHTTTIVVHSLAEVTEIYARVLTARSAVPGGRGAP
jgi:hypothetical protein